MKSAKGALVPSLESPFEAAEGRRAAIERRVRSAILDGALGPGARLPSTRALARELDVSRTTAEEAFAQLVAEGYLVRRVGDGTYVTSALPPPPRPRRSARAVSLLSARGRALASAPACLDAAQVVPFRAAHPDYEAFPLGLWNRLLARRARRSGERLLGYGDAAGLAALREALAGHLATSRGVRCDRSRIVVLSSSQQGMDLAARLVLDREDEAWVEEPGYPGVRGVLATAGARAIPVPVDAHGLDVAAGVRLAPKARLAHVTPSHQYPLGAPLALERRLALLDWATGAGALVLEDDYDGEYRYGGRAIASIQSLDTEGRVLYLGTFTKMLFPSLRLAWAVLPESLVEPFIHARRLQDGQPPGLSQAVAADFVGEGHLLAHLRRMRALYAERREELASALGQELGDAGRLLGAEAGLHAVLPLDADDVEVAGQAARRGLEVIPLSTLYCREPKSCGLVLGYAGLRPAAIRAGVVALSGAIEAARRRAKTRAAGSSGPASPRPPTRPSPP
ncbi:MAG TPA: PLP-dependent aminotransferase family protein [Anaeromyxobacteraceae bacterium]|nr:PLP-dependent aminotransferase family protein [Anaeromyxobacteraceae bacterium]